MVKDLGKKGYKILLIATVANFIAGILYIWSVISKALVSNLNWTSKESSLPYTVLTIFFVIAMVIFGKVQDTKGPRLPATVGGILMGGGLIFSGIFTSPKMMILTMGVVAGTGIGMIYASTSPPVVKWFPPEKKGTVTGIVVAGVGLSAIFYSPLSNYLINTVGISKTFIYLGIFVLATVVPLSLLLENPPKGFIPKSKITKEEIVKDKNTKDHDWKYMLKDPQFYKMWIMLGLSSSAGLMIIGHISNIAKLQVNWEVGFILVILLSIFNSLGRFLGGLISDKIERLTLIRIIFTIQGINMFMFLFYSNVWLLALGVAIVGLCYGAGFSIFPAISIDAYGSKNFGLNYGILFTSWGFGGVIGPMTAATILDLKGSYDYAYITAGILLIFAIITTLTVKKTKIN